MYKMIMILIGTYLLYLHTKIVNESFNYHAMKDVPTNVKNRSKRTLNMK